MSCLLRGVALFAAALVTAVSLSGLASAETLQSEPTTVASGPLLMHWSAPVQVDAHDLRAIACPSTTDCVVVDSAGRILESHNAFTTTARWQLASARPASELLGISCPSTSLCVVATPTGPLWSTSPFDPRPGRWHATLIAGASGAYDPAAVTTVSCPSTSLCVLGDQNGGVLVSTDPDGAAASWKLTAVDTFPNPSCAHGERSSGCPNVVTGLACPTVRVCVGVDDNGSELYSSDPAGGTSAWSSRYVQDDPGEDLTSLTCPTTRLCLSTDTTLGQLLGTSHPANSLTAAPVFTSRWSEVRASTAATVICLRITLCITSDTQNRRNINLLTGNPLSGNWTRGGFTDTAVITGGTCSEDGRCVAIDARGRTVVAKPEGD